MNIKKIKEEIKSLEIYISKNVFKDLQGEELTKLVEAEESRIFKEEKLEELKYMDLKKQREDVKNKLALHCLNTGKEFIDYDIKKVAQ